MTVSHLQITGVFCRNLICRGLVKLDLLCRVGTGAVVWHGRGGTHTLQLRQGHWATLKLFISIWAQIGCFSTAVTCRSYQKFSCNGQEQQFESVSCQMSGTFCFLALFCFDNLHRSAVQLGFCVQMLICSASQNLSGLWETIFNILCNNDEENEQSLVYF